MRVEVLGCSGGIGGAGVMTTSLRVDHDILIDCGTGVGGLSLDELASIDHIFLTHAHFDHIAMLPMLLDMVGDLRDRPLTLHACAGTLEALRTHVFNWKIWPDFTTIPLAAKPVLSLSTMEAGESLMLGGREVIAIPAQHAVPALGFVLGGGQGKLAFSGDTTLSPEQLAALNQIPGLRYLLLETAFPESQRGLAEASRHLSPSMLHAILDELKADPEVFITHLKPAYADTIAREVLAYQGRLKLEILGPGRVFEL